MATKLFGDEEATEPAESEKTEPASDFDVAADALAQEIGAPASPGFRRALREAVMACMGTDYGAEETPKGKDSGLALIFGRK